MPNEKQLIRTITDPTIVLDNMQAIDVEAGTSEYADKATSQVALSKQYGSVYPLVQINDYVFQPKQVSSLVIYSTGDIPSAVVTIYVNDKAFYSVAYPKDGDVMSIFIRSKDDSLKPIRNDYEITDVSVHSRPGGGENTPDTMTVSGTLRVPGYFASKSFSYKSTSFDALQKVASDLNIGFATNETDTSDSQSWICPNEKVQDFIYNTTLASWKNEKSFFTSFIDIYYYLNLVNIEPMFSEKLEIEDGITIQQLFTDHMKDSPDLSKASTKMILSNWDEIDGTPFHIISYELINNSSSINFTEGYKRYMHIYDSLLKEKVQLYVDPLTTPGAEQNMVLLRGRPNENFYKSQVTSKWMGVRYGGDGENQHKNFDYARVNNYQNNVHIQKMGLHVTLTSLNMNLRRYQPITVVIVVKYDYTRKAVNVPEDMNRQTTIPPDNSNSVNPAEGMDSVPFVIDKTLSGVYVITDIVYTYVKGEFRQECTLVRREWPTPPGVNK